MRLVLPLLWAAIHVLFVRGRWLSGSGILAFSEDASRHFHSERASTPLQRGSILFDRLITPTCPYPTIPQPRKTIADAQAKGWLINVGGEIEVDVDKTYGLALIPEMEFNRHEFFISEALIPRGPIYQAFMTVRSGLIIAKYSYRRFSQEEYRWSDLVALTWTHVCNRIGVSPTNLRYIVRDHVNNDETREVIDELCGRASECVETFTPTGPDTRAFAKLLGTPNVNGVAWMLLQNYDILGLKTISEIRIRRYIQYANGHLEIDRRYDVAIKLRSV